MSEQLLDLLADVYGELDLERFRPQLLRALRTAVPADWSSINDIGPAAGDVVSLAEPTVPPELYRTWALTAHTNPLVARYLATHDGRVWRFSDVCTTAELHATPAYREVYSRLGVEHQISFTLPSHGNRLLGVALSRCAATGDFTDAERALLRTARPHLVQAYRNALHHAAARRRAGDLRGTPYADLASLGLTTREIEVARSLAGGRSNADIAEELALSVRTVEKHLQRVYAKLGANGRSEAARVTWSLEELASSSRPGRAPPRYTD